MCQMCDEYEAELRRMGIAVEPAERDKRHAANADRESSALTESADDDGRRRSSAAPAAGNQR